MEFGFYLSLWCRLLYLFVVTFVSSLCVIPVKRLLIASIMTAAGDAELPSRLHSILIDTLVVRQHALNREARLFNVICHLCTSFERKSHKLFRAIDVPISPFQRLLIASWRIKTIIASKYSPFYSLNNSRKPADFNNFWYRLQESWGNDTPSEIGLPHLQTVANIIRRSPERSVVLSVRICCQISSQSTNLFIASGTWCKSVYTTVSIREMRTSCVSGLLRHGTEFQPSVPHVGPGAVSKWVSV